MVANEVGFVQPFDSQAGLSGMVSSLLGATCTLAVKQVYGSYSAQLPLAVQSDNRTCTYTSAAGDFPEGGLYQIQLIASFSNGTKLKSPLVSWPVDYALA